MAEFYGSVKGQRGEESRLGTKSSGLVTTAASWFGAIRVELSCTKDDKHQYRVLLAPWKGRGPEGRVLAEGVFEDEK